MEQTSFYGLPLLTAPGRVMTPRAATERLVAVASERIGERAARVADVGTGSGAIAVALAVAAPRAEIWAVDSNPAAVLLARANARRFCVGQRVHAVTGDLLEPAPTGLDLVVANLPYLPLDERGADPDLSGEPEDAVFAPGDGLGPYRRLLRDADAKLTPSGAVVIQFRRRILVAERAELAALRARLEDVAGPLQAVA
jgi:release factor glutamine methyltransferase